MAALRAPFRVVSAADYAQAAHTSEAAVGVHLPHLRPADVRPAVLAALRRLHELVRLSLDLEQLMRRLHVLVTVLVGVIPLL